MDVLWSLIVLVLVIVAGYLSLRALIEIMAMVRSGAQENLFQHVKKRVASVIDYVFLHKKVLDDKSYGIMHMFYLYGFLILGIGHLELVLYGLTKFFTHFSIEPFLYRNYFPSIIAKLIECSQDIMAALVLGIVCIALYRRIFIPKKRLLPRSKDAETILWLIGCLYLTFFIYIPTETVLRIEENKLAQGFIWHLPISSLLAYAYGLLPTVVLDFLHIFGYFSHLAVFLGFAVYIPRSKHLHLIAAGPNIYFRHLDAVAKPQTIDFETSENFGVDRVDNLSWKSLLDTFACTECGRCDAVCPAALTGKSLHPKKVLHDIKLNLRYKNWSQIKQYKTAFGHDKKGSEEELKNLSLKTPLISRAPDPNVDQKISDGAYDIHGQVHLDDIWACTTCAACVDVCPVLIDSVPISLMDMRRHLVMMEATDYPKEMNPAMRGMEMQKNPWGVGQDKRTEWAKSLSVKTFAERPDEEVEYLFWVGCAGATDDRAKKIQQSLVRILKKANVDFAILGCEEKCTGDPARRMGNEYLFDMLAKENIATLNKYKFKKIFTSCPHCFNSLKNEYKDFGVNFTVQHHSELINELLKDNRLPEFIKNKIKEDVTFHDPCYLGRYNNNYEKPRDVLKTALNKEPVEMSMNKRNSFCCGAGGGKMFMEEHVGKRINSERIDQALKTKAKVVATGCPFCMTMLSDGVKDKNKEDEMKIKDIAEIVDECLTP